MSDRGARPSPPRLRLGLVRKLKVLALANILPILAIGFVGWNISTGEMAIRQDVPIARIGFTVGVLLVCCVVIGASSWVVMPAMRWLRDYPTWHYHNVSSIVWALPTLVGWVVWVGAWIAMAACVIGTITLIVVALWVLASDAGSSHQNPAPPPRTAPPTSSPTGSP